MDDTCSAALHEAELSFFGAVTASLSHQINNVLTIISELNGLSEDLLAMTAAGGLPVERLRATTARISGNLERCVEYLRVLNRFSHSADQESATCNLGELVCLLRSVTTRFFELRKVNLELSLPEKEVVVVTRPFAVLHVLYRALRSALAASGEGETVRLALEAAPNHVDIRVSPMPSGEEMPAGEADLASLAPLCRCLGAQAAFDSDAGVSTLRIVLPPAPSPSAVLETR